MNAVFKIDDFSVYYKEDNERKYIFQEWNSFNIPEPGIYTLEGPNGCGKSILIKMIMGIIVPNVNKDFVGNCYINEKKVKIFNTSDALKSGMVSVFQDDAMIQSMTVREQILLRHATPTFLNYLIAILGFFYDKSIKKIDSLAKLMGIELLTNRFSPPESLRFPSKEVINRANDLFSSYGNNYTNVLNKYPKQLSGGEKAIVRLVISQLYKDIKILFLDEAFNAVQSNSWPNILETIRAWAIHNKVTILAISHNKEELIRWQPKIRFEIRDKKIVPKDTGGYLKLESGIPTMRSIFPVFSYPYNNEWVLSNLQKGNISIIIDSSIKENIAYKYIVLFIKSLIKKELNIIEVRGGESVKDFSNYKDLIIKLIQNHPCSNGSIFIVGGGATLNLGMFLSATLHRGLLNTILVPTTLMAMADVAVGSKASININCTYNRKNIIGTYNNPAAIFLDKRFLKTLSVDKIQDGLSEVLKHGLLQSSNLYNETIELLKQSNPSPDHCFDIALKAMDLKSRILTVDPWEKNYGRLLLYGHLHAHCAERSLDYNISHGLAVLWGILLDLRIGNNELYLNLLHQLSLFTINRLKIINTINLNELSVIYKTDPKDVNINDNGSYRIIMLNSIGQYTDSMIKINYLDIFWEDVFENIMNLNKEINEISNNFISGA